MKKPPQQPLRPNDILPIGYPTGAHRGTMRVLCNDNGLGYMPESATVIGKGNGDYHDVLVEITEQNLVALALCGVNVKGALKYRAPVNQLKEQQA